MHPDLHLRLHRDREAAAARAHIHRQALPQRARPPGRLRPVVAARLRRLADAVEPRPQRAA